jgi:biopolymer transport protein ExbD
MRFARQAMIFRGPLDAGPVVGVLFLLVIFILLGSLLYTPGVLVKFEGSGAPDAQTITVTSDGDIVLAGKTNKATELDQLRAEVRAEDLKNATNSQPFRLQVEPGADPELVEQVRGLFQVQLPDGDNLTGTDNPTVIVAVNFRGQCFFENKPVQEQELKDELRRRLQEASRASKKLTMVLWADKAAENEVVMRLYRLARDVGVTEFLLAERPSPFAAPAGRSQP